MKTIDRRGKKVILITGFLLLVVLSGLIPVILQLVDRGKPVDEIPAETIKPPVTTQQPASTTVGPAPGLIVTGRVSDQAGSGVENVRIYRSYASYAGVVIATTDANGDYASDFYPIPGDEMVTIWAEKPGLVFEPENYYWRHYYGFEHVEYEFTITLP